MRFDDWVSSEGRVKKWVAHKLGVSPATVSKLLSGERKPSIEVAIKIYHLTDGQVGLLDWEDESEKEEEHRLAA